MKKIHRFSILLLGVSLLCFSCQPQKKTPIALTEGTWRGELTLKPDAILPFIFQLQRKADSYHINIHNGQERIEVEQITQKGDSLFIQMPVFDSEFRLKIDASGELTGNWYDYTRGVDYHVPFRARQGITDRFESTQSPGELAPKYSVTFDPTGEKPAPAIGDFTQEGKQVIGNFQTETGDYRFLEGVMDGNTLKLSAFDGSHAFLFIADVTGDSISGNFWAGVHWLEPWSGAANPDAAVRSPEELTYLRPGYEKFGFKFPNLEGDSISFNDQKFQDKVTLVQLMGSWCPNCMDETRLYAQWHKKYQVQGLEIVGVAFERTSKGMPQAKKNIQRMSKRLKADYPFLIAATNNEKSLASEKFPMLNEIISFPTSIFLDRKGRVRKIHTGFNGPGTGDLYTRYVEEYEAFIEKMLAEK